MALNPFSSNIALSPGSANYYVARGDGREVFSAPSCALVSADNSTEVTALGSEARKLEGRTAHDTLLVNPMSFGAVGDSELAAMLMLDACENATGKRHPLEKNRLVITYPDGATKVERAALVNAAKLAGAKRVLAVKAPIAAAVSFGRRVDKAEGHLTVSIGKYITEVCVISGGAVAISRHMKTGSHALDSTIVQCVRKKCALVIGESTAEALKKDMGSATQPRSASVQSLSGRSILTGKPVTAEISSSDIYDALVRPIDDIVGAVCDALYSLPAQFSADILKNGIILTGGGAALYGLSKRFIDDTQLPVAISEEPAYDEVRGALKIAADDRLTRQLINAYSAYEA